MKTKLWATLFLAGFTASSIMAQCPIDKGKACKSGMDKGKAYRFGMDKRRGEPGKREWMDKKHSFQKLANYLGAEKCKELKKLKESDPEKFRDEVKKIMKEVREKKRAEHMEIKQLVEEYKKTPGEDTKKKLREILEKQFAQRLEASKTHIEKMEEKIKQQKERLEKRIKQKDAIVTEKLEDMLQDSDLKW